MTGPGTLPCSIRGEHFPHVISHSSLHIKSSESLFPFEVLHRKGSPSLGQTPFATSIPHQLPVPLLKNFKRPTTDFFSHFRVCMWCWNVERLAGLNVHFHEKYFIWGNYDLSQALISLLGISFSHQESTSCLLQDFFKRELTFISIFNETRFLKPVFSYYFKWKCQIPKFKMME